jgi:hypothetical protein
VGENFCFFRRSNDFKHLWKDDEIRACLYRFVEKGENLFLKDSLYFVDLMHHFIKGKGFYQLWYP